MEQVCLGIYDYEWQARGFEGLLDLETHEFLQHNYLCMTAFENKWIDQSIQFNFGR